VTDVEQQLRHAVPGDDLGESHGAAIGCVVDGTPPRLALAEAEIQHWLDRRKPGQSRFTTQRREPDRVRILSGVLDGLTTGTPISLYIDNEDARSKDYEDIKDKFRPGHADYAYWVKYGIRDYRGGGRSSARETAMRVAAGAVARKVLGPASPSAVRWSSSGRTRSTARGGIGPPSKTIRSGAPTAKPRRPGKVISMRSVKPARPAVP